MSVSQIDQMPRNGFYIQWHFLDDCNLRCAHCYQGDSRPVSPSIEHLTSVYNELSRTITTWKKRGRLALTGGEPFLEFEKLLHLLKLAEADAAFHWAGVLTNGTLLDQDRVTTLKTFSKLKEVQVSLDGDSAVVHDGTRGTGSFSAAMSGLESLVTGGVFCSVMFTLTKSNMNSALRVVDLCDRLGVDAVTIERYTPIGNSPVAELSLAPEDLEQVFTGIAERKMDLSNRGAKLRIRTSRPLWHLVDPNLGGFCPVGFSSVCIMPDGTVYPCRRLPIPLGNVLNEGMFKIWYKSEVLWYIRRKKGMGLRCGGCSDLYRCGGCRAAAYAVNEDYLGDDPLCWKQNR